MGGRIRPHTVLPVQCIHENYFCRTPGKLGNHYFGRKKLKNKILSLALKVTIPGNYGNLGKHGKLGRAGGVFEILVRSIYERW